MTKLSVVYDRPVDVLHIRNGRAGLFEADDLERGVELDFSIVDGAPCGVTVIGFNRNNWISDVDSLARLAAKHLSVSPECLATKISEKVRQTDINR